MGQSFTANFTTRNVNYTHVIVSFPLRRPIIFLFYSSCRSARDPTGNLDITAA